MNQMRELFEKWWSVERFPLMLPEYVKEDDWNTWKAAVSASVAPANNEEFECCGCLVDGNEYMGQVQMMCCGKPEPAGAAQSAAVPVVGDVDCYDAGLLSNFGGGNVEWWQDYIRAELARAHEFYVSQIPTTSITAAELDALRNDAERFESLCAALVANDMDYGKILLSCIEHQPKSIDEIRDAIDAAIAGEK